MNSLIHILAALCSLLALCGVAYYTLCTIAARNFLRDSKRVLPSDFTPPVSIFKPLRGADPEMYQAFRSHCLQDYPDFELIFGVSDPHDPAINLVNRLQREFPERSIRLIFCNQLLGANGKVSNLVQMLPHARYEHLLVNDSDIRVAPDYLRRIFAPFANERVGMVTALYRGLETGTLGSKLEAIGIVTDFAAGVLAARQLEGIHFALGSTLAFTKTGLAAIGGFESLLDYLADDYELGARLSANGYEVVLSDAVVDTFIHDYDFKGFWLHQQRWARTIRDARKAGYIGVGVTFGLPWAMLAVMFARGAWWAWALLCLTALVRFVMAHMVAKRVLQYRDWLRHAWLVPLRDLFALAVWFASFAGHTIVWRGDVFVLKNGRLHRGDRC
jgi:ceramide glucosyltransferase